MKTINSIQRLIDTELHAIGQHSEEVVKCDANNDKAGKKKAEKELKKARKELDQLTYYKRYLESSPNEQFLKGQLFRLNSQIASLKANFEKWQGPKDKDPVKEWPAIFNKEVGMSKMQNQVKAIKFLLD